MAKIKPNEPCPCDSGKKYKKCCGSPMRDQQEVAARNSSSHPPLRGTWGLSGVEMSLSLLRHYEDPDDPRNQAHPGGSPGKYKVSFVLSRPRHDPLKENEISFADNVRGDSHIFLGDPNQVRAELEAMVPEGKLILYGYPNDAGFLSKIEIEELEAFSFGDALLKAYNAVSPTLSRLSLMLEVPLHIYRTITIESSTQNLMSHLTLPFIAQRVPAFTDYQPQRSVAKFSSLYREALNSNSPNYQYLCYYKIIEGIKRIRKDRATKENQEALIKGIAPPTRERELIPKNREEQVAWLNNIFTPRNWSDLALRQIFPEEVTGRKLNDVIAEGKPLDMVRNKIAHAVLRTEGEETFTIDDGTQIGEVMKWLALCKCIARYLLKKEFPEAFK